MIDYLAYLSSASSLLSIFLGYILINPKNAIISNIILFLFIASGIMIYDGIANDNDSIGILLALSPVIIAMIIICTYEFTTKMSIITMIQLVLGSWRKEYRMLLDISKSIHDIDYGHEIKKARYKYTINKSPSIIKKVLKNQHLNNNEMLCLQCICFNIQHNDDMIQNETYHTLRKQILEFFESQKRIYSKLKLLNLQDE